MKTDMNNSTNNTNLDSINFFTKKNQNLRYAFQIIFTKYLFY